jgi:hypothetical protein
MRYKKRTEKQYLADVERIAQQNGLQGSGQYILGEEIGFTWDSCDICGDPHGGDKHEVSALIHNEDTGLLEPVEMGEACTDCTIYIANGDLSGHDFAEEQDDGEESEKAEDAEAEGEEAHRATD